VALNLHTTLLDLAFGMLFHDGNLLLELSSALLEVLHLLEGILQDLVEILQLGFLAIAA
jgi:hypothetical protein